MRSCLHLLLPTLALALVTASCGQSGGNPPPPGPPPVNGPDAPTDLNYARRVLILAIGESIIPQPPTFAGVVESFSITPALPAGMLLDSLNGKISGTPTGFSPRTLYEVSAVNFDGVDRTTIEVLVGGESRFAYSGSSTDGTVSEFGVESAAGKLFHQGWAGGPATPIQQVVVNPAGSVLLALDQFELSSWLIDPGSGRLSPGVSTGLGAGPHSLAMHPFDDFVFVTTRAADLLRAYSIDPVSGALTLVSSVPTAFEPRQVLADPLGRYLIVRHSFSATPGSEQTPFRGYTIESGSGILTESSQLGMFGVRATEMTLGPFGEALYMTLTLPVAEVLHSSVDTLTGRPTAVSLHPAGTDPMALHVAPDGGRLYVLNGSSDDLTLFNIDSSDGTLTLDSTQAVSTGTNAFSFSFDGRELFLVNSSTQIIETLTVDGLTGLLGASTSLRTRPGAQVMSHVFGERALARRAANLFVLNQTSEDVSAFDVDVADGSLIDGGATPIAAGTSPTDLVVDPGGRFVYVSQSSLNQIIGYAIQPDGSLVDLALPTDLVAGAPVRMGIDPSGQFVFVLAAGFQNLFSFEVQGDGSLLAVDAQPMGDNPTSIDVDPTGRYVYVSVGGDGSTLLGELRPFELNPQSGALLPLPPIPAPGFPESLVFDARGARAYVTLRNTALVQAFDVNLDGSFSAIGSGSLTGSLPHHLALSNDGRFAYLVYESVVGDGGLLLYDVEPTTGELIDSNTLIPQWREFVPSGVDPFQVAISPDGRHVYALARTSEEIQVLETNPLTGQATFRQSQASGLTPVRMGLKEAVE